MNDTPILLVDDEQALIQLLDTVFRKEGFSHIDHAATAEEAIEACRRKSYGVIVLDVTLPGMSGIEACPFIRSMTDAPILFLSARSTDFDKLSGFAVGGDDYVTKPFNPLEIVARIRSLIRRSGGAVSPQIQQEAARAGCYDFGRFQVDEHAVELIVENRYMPCPPLVFQLLLFFVKNPNRVFTKSELYERVWGDHSISDDNTVMVHIHRIRERIEQDPARPEFLVNVRGMGYKLVKKTTEYRDEEKSAP